MSNVLLNLDDHAAVIAHIEANTAAFLMAMGEAGGGQQHNSPSITWTIGGSPLDYHNAVVHAHLTPAEADQVIRDVIAEFKAHQVPGSWHLGPSMQPADLGQRLEAQGFSSGGSEPGMAAYLPDLNETISTPTDFHIERVRDEQTLAAWAKVLAAGFGEGEREANWVASVYATIGLDDSTPWRHYLGLLNGEPVATSSIYCGAGVAGIYFVSTIPTARRQGIGAAITLAALRDARDMGYRVGVLGASEAGYQVYERLGFRQFCEFAIYEWHPT